MSAPFLGLLLLPAVFFPFFTDPFMVPKWLALHLLAAGVAFSELRRSEISLPRLGKRWAWPVAMAVLYVASAAHAGPGPYVSQTLDFLCFGILALAAFDRFMSPKFDWQEVYRLNRHGTVLVLAFAGAELLSLGLWTNREPSFFLSSTFGFQNLTAEFLGLSLLFQLAGLFSSRKKSRGDLVLAALTLSYLFSTLCRSAALACFVAVLPWFVRKRPPWRAVSLILVVTLLFALSLARWRWGDQLGGLLTQKATNVSLRLARWRNTVQLIVEHPWGVGPGNFEFGYVPYRGMARPDDETTPTSLPRSPHNGFLEATAEGGILFGAAVLAFIVAAGIFLFRRRSTLAQSLYLFFVIDACFAFPMETAYPFYVAALTLALGLSLDGEKKTMRVAPLRIPLVVSGLAILMGTAFVSGSDYLLATQSENEVAMTRVCEWFPEEWRACAQKAKLEGETNPRAALQTAKGIVARNELNFFGWELLRKNACRLGLEDEAREALARYERIWRRTEQDNSCP